MSKMKKSQPNNFFKLFIVLPLLGTVIKSEVILEQKNMHQAIIDFDPYVSTLDKGNQFRHNVSDLQILIGKVATRFSRIYIELTLDDLKMDQLQSTSRFLSPLATAKYNAVLNTTQNVELWLGLNHDIFNNDSMIPELMRRVFSIIKRTNEAHAGTLTTLIIPQTSFDGNNSELIAEVNSTSQIINMKKGLLIDPPFTCDKLVFDLFEPNLIIFRGNFDDKFESELQQQLDEYKVQIEMFNRTVTMGVMHSVPDTGTDNILRTSKLVSSWEQAIKWANSSGNIVILSSAFDLPYKYEIANKTTGWWRLVENSSYTSVSDYVFEEKYLVAKQIDWEENPENFQWLQNSIHFHVNTTAMLFQEDELSKPEIKSTVINTLRNSNITRILVVDKKYLKQGSVMKYSEIDAASDGLNFTVLNRYSKNGVEQNTTQNVGLYFSRSTCDTYQKLEATLKQKLFDTLANTYYNLFVFYYIEKTEIVKLGARRMFQQRVVKLDLCREMVLKSSNTKTPIGYVLLEYPDLSPTPWALQNLVKYYKLLNDWAITQTNINIFLPALDRMKIGSNTPMLGWWRVNSSENEMFLIDKRTDALYVSQTRSKPILNQSDLNEDRIILIVSTTIAMIVTVTAVSILFINRSSRAKNKLSNNDLLKFFNGIESDDISDTDNYCKMPYDKLKYEIEQSKFSIDGEVKVLGVGEFGRVLKGKAERNGNVIDAAIKTTNPETSHMNALKGLLGEIKLLAYIGKHPNITELIGANTEHLRRGKCWIILELCHLGSLQKYLREIGIPTNSSVVEYSPEYVNFGDGYSNIPMNTVGEQLDMELSGDLFRWSKEICSAMVYLAEKHVVHADLATRNVLLDLRKVAKICDFGLSRRMYNYTDYVKTNQEPLPWKWMAPESLRLMQFSEKSDVWSFGITLWEIYSLGEVPYQGMSWDVNFAQMLERGLRLSEPRYNEHNMFEIMRSCWKISADERPKFSTLFNLLTTI